MKIQLLVSQIAVLVLAGCATNGGSTATNKPEALLTSSGFQARQAQTDQEKQQLTALPDGKMCAVRRNGKRYYVYPDKEHNEVYVGNEAAHKRFQSGLRSVGNADAVTTVYDQGGTPIQVNRFDGFGPWPGE